MKNLLLGMAVSLACSTTLASAEETVRIGVLLGFTGPVESLTPDMAASAHIAFEEAGKSGAFLGGRTITVMQGDSTCADAGAATAAADRLVSAERVAAIFGAACSGATMAVATNVAIPNGVVQISPSATSPALSVLKDNGLFFRTAPSDARQGEVLARIAHDKGIRSVAVTYTNNDYGKGLANSFARAYRELGGEIAIEAAHEDGRGDYSAEVASLTASGAKHLLVIGYVDQGGTQIVRTALDLGGFDGFILPDGMIGDTLLDAVGDGIDGAIAVLPGSETKESKTFNAILDEAGIEGAGPYKAESYDAAALLVLAMQAAGSADRDAIAGRMLEVANAPGTKIGPGEIARGLKILAEGGEIDFVGATNVELTDIGEAAGSFREMTVENGEFTPIRIW